MKNLKSPKLFIPYSLLAVITLILIYFDVSFERIKNPSIQDIVAETLICIQPALWIYFEKAGFKNTNQYPYYLMISGMIIFYSGTFQDIMDEVYKLEGPLSELENTLTPIGLLLISIAVILRFLEERKINLILAKKSKSIYTKSIKDPLTELYNRYYFEENFEKILKKITDSDLKTSVVFIDVDNFKFINDTQGHVFGDEFLRNLGIEINKGIRKDDYAFRYGGDEFLIIYTDTKLETALKVTERIKKNISMFAEEKGIKLSLSIGITNYKKYESSKILIGRADKAMYQSKMNGKNQITVVVN